MPLLVVSPNLQDGTESPSRKRSHQDYLYDDAPKSNALPGVENSVMQIDQPSPTLPDIQTESTPSGSPESLLTDVGTTPLRPLSPPTFATPTKLSPTTELVINIDVMPPKQASSNNNNNNNGPPPAKRKRLTPAEREEKAKADAARKEEKEKADALRKQEKEEQKAAAEAEKKARAEEREKKQKQREEENRRKAEEKEKKRKEKEEEERKVQEAKDKKERNQLRLNSFFKTGPSTPKKVAVDSTSIPTSASTTQARATSAGPSVKSPEKSPQKPQATTSAYDRMFKPFFVKENVVMATDLYGLDDETKTAKSRILDECMSGKRGAFAARPMTADSAVDYFQLPCKPSRPRGRSIPSVRQLVASMSDYADVPDATTQKALDQLKKVPMKFLGFREDVRPAYFGTATNIPSSSKLSKLARNPLAKTVLPLQYDYDSEAEWVDDDDGEDVDDLLDDLDDDDGLLDDNTNEEEMTDFLDDSEDAAPILRPAFSSGMEPESTGLCFETADRQPVQPAMETYRMEFILDHDGPIDPFSTQYWEPTPAEPPTTTTTTTTSASTMAPPLVPSDAFAALGAGAAATATSNTTTTTNTNTKTDAKKAGVAAEYVDDFKKAILQYAKLSKLGLIEMLSVEFEKCTKSQIKNSVEAVAERTGTGQQKTWKLKDGQ